MNEIDPVQASDPHKLVEALMHSSKDLESQLDAVLGAAVGVSATKWYALHHLAEAGGQLPLGQLADRLSCVKSNATQLADRLKAEQLVRRVPDPQDRRVILAELTSEGYQCYEAGLAVVQAFERELVGDFKEEERILLYKLLSRLGSFTSVIT